MDEKELELLIEGVDDMVWDLAGRCWRNLPLHARAWLDVEDLHQEGLCILWKQGLKWNPSKGKFSTFAYTTVRNNFISVFEALNTRKRNGGIPTGVEVLDYRPSSPRECEPPLVDSVIASWYG